MWLWSIAWGIIGSLIGLAISISISGGTLYEAIINPQTIGREHIVPVSIGALIAMIIMGLGLWTALIKVVTEGTLEELKK